MDKKEYISSITDLWTHSGKFHADDVFAFAALRMMGCTAKLHRVNQLPENLGPTDLIFDIGGGKYDHHQMKREIRANGVPYAAFGLIVREFYLLLGLSVHEYHALDKCFIRSLDGTDNKYFSNNAISGAIAVFNPQWDHDTGEEAQMQAFLSAASVAEMMLKQQIDKVKADSRARSMVSLLLETVEYHTVFMDRYAPVSKFLKFNEDVHWLCSLSTRGDWTICSVNGPKGTPKAIMPKEFRGASADSLPEGMLFCHPKGFIASFDSLLSARLFAKRYLANADLYNGSDQNEEDSDED